LARKRFKIIPLRVLANTSIEHVERSRVILLCRLLLSSEIELLLRCWLLLHRLLLHSHRLLLLHPHRLLLHAHRLLLLHTHRLLLLHTHRLLLLTHPSEVGILRRLLIGSGVLLLVEGVRLEAGLSWLLLLLLLLLLGDARCEVVEVEARLGLLSWLRWLVEVEYVV